MSCIPRPLGDGGVPAYRNGTGDVRRGAIRPGGAQTRFEDVAEEIFGRYARIWKPRTVAVNRSYLRNQILPWFRERSIGDITGADVQRWFAALHATPAAADRSLPILSVILRQAAIYGPKISDRVPERDTDLYELAIQMSQVGEQQVCGHDARSRLAGSLRKWSFGRRTVPCFVVFIGFGTD